MNMATSVIKNQNLKFTQIQENTDLNNLKELGFYGCASGATAETLLNSPINTNFAMLVLKKSTLTTQIITTAAAIYIRTEASTGWQAWYRYQGTVLS